MNASVVYPVKILREQITGLEAAVAVCLASPDHKPVHKLRTETRRVEALLLLVGLVPDLPGHRKEAAAMMRALKKLRRAAGAVRDLDVHRKMLEAFAGAEEHAAAVGETGPASLEKEGEAPSSAPEKRGHKKKHADKAVPEVEATPTTAELLSQSATELREEMGRARDKAADALQKVLTKRQAKTTEAAEALLQTLDPAKDAALPGTDLLRDTEAMLTRDGLLGKGKIEKLGKHDLHTVRKTAKKARYLAESLPEDAALAAAARHFESLQEAGGQWHDAMQLARAARQHFGKGHELTVTYHDDRDRKLATYRAALASTVKPKRDAEEAASEPTKSTRRKRKPAPAAA